jgi:hypothetical protein
MELAPEDSPTWENVPKFVLGDCGTDRFFVIHLHKPRFVGEVFENDDDSFDIEPLWIDPEPDEREPLLKTAAEFYLASFEWERPDPDEEDTY